MNLRKNEGITLIALIITIIVMLILAVVAISAITGNNGLIGKVQNSVDISNAAAFKEQVDMDIADAQMQLSIDKHKIATLPTNVDFIEILEGKGYAVTDNEDGTITVEKDGGKAVVNADFTTTVEGVPTNVGGGTTSSPEIPPTGIVSYSITDITNQPVIAIITTSKLLGIAPTGWTQIDDTHYTRTYTINIEEDIAIQDTSGNTGTVHVSIANIDSTVPNGMASYSPDTTTTGSVTVTITTNKAINTPSGWTMVAGSSGTQFTKIYTSNLEEDITITDTASNIGTVHIAIENIQTMITNGTWDGTVNAPVLSAGMTAVAWNASNTEFTPTIGADWYNYTAQTGATTNGGTSKWANTKTTNGSYLVWIPRYEYKITSGEHTSTTGAIDVKFIPASQTTPDSGYKIHPAFTNSGNGGFGELAGIWAGKYTSSNDGSSNIKVMPDAPAWVNIQVSDIFTKCRLFNSNNSITGMDSHMMKNSEWGAVAYLAQSQYGRNNTEVTINNYYVGNIAKTGYAGGSVSASSDTTGTNSYLYNTPQGVLASTTGNITGVYDMSGCAWEYVAAYVNNGNANLTTYCSSLINAETKYKEVYPMGSTDTQANNYTAAAGIYGDAVYETSSSATGPTSWFTGYSGFPAASGPVFVRRRLLH